MNTDELELLSNSKYRQFGNAVDKALKNFEYSSEWADLISALGKLNKVLILHPKFKVVPRKIVLAKRLQQCMHPALPSGVHLKALETYELIFRRLGNKGLAQDLFIYSSGLFPLLGNAAMSVKPVLMTIYEEYFVSLGKALIPFLPGLLLVLLPGIEECSEYTNRTMTILDSISQKTDMATFYGTLWSCMLTSTSVRLPAVMFIMSRLNKKAASKQDYILGNDIPLMVQAVSVALSEPDVLVQRSLLEFLLTFLPMNTELVTQPQKVKLVGAGLNSLLRRDMSLNRRLYSWLLGPENNKPTQRAELDSISSIEDDVDPGDTYFDVYSKPSTVEALKELFRKHYTSSSSGGSKKTLKNEALWPFRILISLLDRPEIGSTVLEDVLIEVFRLLYFRCKTSKSKNSTSEEIDSLDELVLSDDENSTDASNKSKITDDIVKTANLLFNAFEPYFMWEYTCKLLSVSFVEEQQKGGKEGATGESAEKSQSTEDTKIPSASFSEVLRLTDFLLDVVALESDIETQTEHWPRLLCHVTMEMTSRCQSLTVVEIGEGISLCSKLLSKVMPSMKSVEDSPKDGTSMTGSYIDCDFDIKNDDLKDNQKTLTEKSSESESSSSDTKSDRSNGSKGKDEQGQMNEGKGRVVQVARISQSADGWSVVDLRKRLETEVNGDASDQRLNYEDNESDGSEINKTEDEIKKKDTAKQTQNGKRDNEVKESRNEIEKEDESEGYDEWSECQETVDVTNQMDALKSASGVSMESTDSSFSKAATNAFQPSLVQSCVHYFQTFFSEFVNQRIISAKGLPIYERNESSNRRHSAVILEELLSKSEENESRDSSIEKKVDEAGSNDVISEKGLDARLPWEHESSLLCGEAFAAACRLLVELSCFPVYCTNDFTYHDPNQLDGELCRRLPEWLQALIVCCFRVEDFNIQSSAVGTLLDLVNLTLSVAPNTDSERPKSTVVVVVIPMISHANLSIIEESCIYKVIAESLWRRLLHHSCRYHQRIVELFLQLHSLTPRPSLCENVITNLLIHQDKESRIDNHWKFAVFWHTARNVVIQDSGRTSRLGDVRPLDRALFIMLDGLESNDPEIRVLTKQWLAHALQHGDLGRLLDPLLVLLLHPATARLSVLHACSLEHKAKSADQSTAPDSRSRKSTLDLDDLRSPSGSELEIDSDREQKNKKTRRGSKGSAKDKDKNNPQKQLQNKQKQNFEKYLVHPLDQHKLVYQLIYDSKLTLYAFSTLLSVLRSAPHQFVCAAATCSVSSSNTAHQDKIKVLLARHRKSLLGKGFYGPLHETPLSPTSGKQKSSRLFAGSLLYLRPNTSKYLEILISVSLYYIRSEYPASLDLNSMDIDGNTEVQITSADVLTLIIWQLVEVVRENAVGIGPFINDLFTRCKVQKALLHCLVSTLYERTGNSPPNSSDKMDVLPPRVSKAAKPSQLRAFQVKLLKLIQAIFVLEDNIEAVESVTPEHLKSPAKTDNEASLQNNSTRYYPGKTLAYQSMLLSAVMHGLQYDDFDLHHEWLRFVIACLPHMKGALGTWVTVIVQQVGKMLQAQTGLYVPLTKTDNGIAPHSLTRSLTSSHLSLPPDYILSLLEHLGTICHFCLVDIMPTSPGLSLKPRSAPFPALTGGTSANEGIQSSQSSGQIFANLLHAFSSQSSTASPITSTEGTKPFLEAREGLLSILPSVLTALISVWSAWNPDVHEGTGQRLPSESYLDLIGSPKAVRFHVLELLTPIVMNHTIIFLASLADVWHQRGKRSRQSTSKSNGPVVTRATEEQAAIVDIVYALKALSFDDTIDTVKQIVRQVTTSKEKSTATQNGLEVHILQFFYHYMEKSAHNQIVNARPVIILLMKEGLQLNQPPALFLLLVILRSYVQRIPLQEDKKAKKELQDITQRLIEACNIVAGSSLENAAWFRRSISVIPQIDTTSSSTDQFTESEVSDSEPALEPISLAKAISSSSSHYSTQALSVMAEVLAPLLDVVFGSEEKDRVTSLLTTVMYNVTPYLKHHSPSNIPNFRACCAVVASLSGYQYMRRAWKRDVMEQVMDNSFFQMDITCIGSWRTIIDNLMTQDTTSFKDLMARVAGFSQSASINIFANREQEMEQRAQLLKKLAFVIFCSEVDQYQYCLPEIQERLAECLRLPQSPVLHEQVFLALRVLLLRMSPRHLTSLWPVIISETVHVMLQLESDLSTSDKSQDQRALISETLLGTNGYVAYSQEKWLGLYLAAFKLLDLTLSLPGDRLPHFQMYRWAFEGGETNCGSAMTTKSGASGDGKTEKVTIFKPHIARISKLLRKRCRRPEDITDLQRTLGRPLLTMYHIKSLDQLLPFLKCISKPQRSDLFAEDSKSKGDPRGIILFERIVERDFLESLVVD